jgi:hypothetical protein
MSVPKELQVHRERLVHKVLQEPKAKLELRELLVPKVLKVQMHFGTLLVLTAVVPPTQLAM